MNKEEVKKALIEWAKKLGYDPLQKQEELFSKISPNTYSFGGTLYFFARGYDSYEIDWRIRKLNDVDAFGIDLECRPDWVYDNCIERGDGTIHVPRLSLRGDKVVEKAKYYERYPNLTFHFSWFDKHQFGILIPANHIVCSRVASVRLYKEIDVDMWHVPYDSEQMPKIFLCEDKLNLMKAIFEIKKEV